MRTADDNRSWEDSFCDLPEITEVLTRELAAMDGAATADVGPFYKQHCCIFGFVTQTCYMYVHLFLSCRGCRR